MTNDGLHRSIRAEAVPRTVRGYGNRYRRRVVLGVRMSDEFHFVSAKTLSKSKTGAPSNSSVILTVMRHNLRELYFDEPSVVPSTIDLTQSHRNRVLAGSAKAAEVSALADAWLKSSGVKVRKNASMAVEIVFSLPRKMRIEAEAYFKCATEWAGLYFAVPVLSSVMHDDQDHPHAHVVLLPLRDGKLVGSALLGNRSATIAMQADFHEKVGKRFGMSAPKRKRKRGLAERMRALDVAASYVAARTSLSAEAVAALLAPHCHDPFTLLAKLGVALPQRSREKSFVEIMTKPCIHEGGRARYQVPV
jgi:hypothetical protein